MTLGQISEMVCYHSLAAVSSGSSSAVERQLPKLDVAGSIPVSRSIFPITWQCGESGGVFDCVQNLWSFHWFITERATRFTSRRVEASTGCT